MPRGLQGQAGHIDKPWDATAALSERIGRASEIVVACRPFTKCQRSSLSARQIPTQIFRNVAELIEDVIDQGIGEDFALVCF